MEKWQTQDQSCFWVAISSYSGTYQREREREHLCTFICWYMCMYTKCNVGFWLLICYVLFQVPNFKGKKKVMISIVPESVGKPTIKLPKTSIIDGICLWESPVYETIKLIKDSSTGIYKENVFHFIVSTVRICFFLL